MNYKVDSLNEKIYKNFITGVYGDPRIPTTEDIVSKLEEFTTSEYSPIMSRDRLTDINISGITAKFSGAIDDLDVMYSSIEKESSSILDQLTSSLKEHNGIKRELKKIKSRVEDIQSGKLGAEYIKYQFTESFDDTSNINLLRSNPINIDAGIFEIQRNSSRFVNLSHYYGHKLEWTITESISKIKENGYVGAIDAAVILDPSDSSSLNYRIVTDRPTRLKSAIVLQLTPDEKEVDINSIQIGVDSISTKGHVRVYFRQSYVWKDIPTLSIQEIKGDLVSFNFAAIKATHIRIEFIKDNPDKSVTNEYFLSISNITISKADTKRTASVYSKPIDITSYNNEEVVVAKIRSTLDADIPEGCDVSVYVAQDVRMNGGFLDGDGQIVDPASAQAVTFDPLASGEVYLSDIMEAPRELVSGLEPYTGLDFSWKKLKVKDQLDADSSDVIEFANVKDKPLIINSLYSLSDEYKWGDTTYTDGYPLWAASGWCNTDNPSWAYLAPYVASGILVSGVEIAISPIEISDGSNGNILNPAIAEHPLYSGQWLGYGVGYPFAHYVPTLGRTLRFDDYRDAIDGWWRPYASTVTPTGILPDFSEVRSLSDLSLVDSLKSDYVSSEPDFYFNNNYYYKIYKISRVSNIIDSTVRLYTYQSRPIEGDENNICSYPHSWVWKYESPTTSATNTVTNVTASQLNINPNYLDVRMLNQSEEMLLDGILELRLHNTNVVLSSPNNYTTVLNSNGGIDYIDLTPMQTTHPYINIQTAAFDYKYSYKIKDNYSSTWTTFAIVPPTGSSPEIKIQNPPTLDGRKVIYRISVTDLDDGSVIYSLLEPQDFYSIVLSNTTDASKHFKIVLHCKSDSSTGFSANIQKTNTPYVPNDSANIIVSDGVMFVRNLIPIQLVDFSTLIYDTHLNNDSRCAITNDFSNERYIVVKEPSKKIFPGYGFNSLSGCYFEFDNAKNSNKGHYVRYAKSPTSNDTITYTTGSIGNTVFADNVITHVDTGWNKGQTIPGTYSNTIQDVKFPVHSSYAYPIHINKSEKNVGYLFYNTAENLPGFYSIGYKSALSLDKSSSRFMYKIKLDSNKQGNLTPVVRSVRFVVND